MGAPIAETNDSNPSRWWGLSAAIILIAALAWGTYWQRTAAAISAAAEGRHINLEGLGEAMVGLAGQALGMVLASLLAVIGVCRPGVNRWMSRAALAACVAAWIAVVGHRHGFVDGRPSWYIAPRWPPAYRTGSFGAGGRSSPIDSEL